MKFDISDIYNLVGKSFSLLDGTTADIYMCFNSLPTPFFLIKRRGTYNFIQIYATELLQILITSGYDFQKELS
jgi:hypothetical protein